ncbi:NrsF family protein [Noviherbaspirillum pedocola]|uniref:DUF1109 domain-containing protein n=1 Tax=Noviherbaspirillum pedocola TaxID=2801341 RepID=A0A934SUI9_9BURK|nr:DUF1109 domain-containing protein [Noviherbaspirillum pedocola]MBK4733019.1 DUF1109 domain-containing protein [Noviherbaspirillum pedocola]
MNRTNDLINLLVADVKPVKRLRAPIVRAACWILFAMLIMVLVGIAHGLRPDWELKLGQPRFLLGVAAAITTGLLAAVAAFMVSVPGTLRRWLLLPIPAAGVWFGTIGYGCLSEWVAIGPDGISFGETARCFATLGLVGMPLSLLMLLMLRHVARLSPNSVAMTGSLSVAAMTAAALSVFHPLDATIMILIWNLGLAALFVWLSGKYARRIFEWMESQ